MRPALEPGYEAQCAQEGPYADDEVTEEVEDFEAMVAAMHRDGMEDDVTEEQEAVSESDPEAELYAQACNIVDVLGPQRTAALINNCQLRLRKLDEENLRRRRELDAAMGKRTQSGRRTRSDAGTKRAPRESTVGGEELTARAERRAAS